MSPPSLFSIECFFLPQKQKNIFLYKKKACKKCGGIGMVKWCVSTLRVAGSNPPLPQFPFSSNLFLSSFPPFILSFFPFPLSLPTIIFFPFVLFFFALIFFLLYYLSLFYPSIFFNFYLFSLLYFSFYLHPIIFLPY